MEAAWDGRRTPKGNSPKWSLVSQRAMQKSWVLGGLGICKMLGNKPVHCLKFKGDTN